MQIAADNAVFGQTGPKVGSFDAGYGSSQMVRLIGSLPIFQSAHHNLLRFFVLVLQLLVLLRLLVLTTIL